MTSSNVHLAVCTGRAGTLVAAPGYERLVRVFTDAHNQAAFGKGKERHANDLPFEKQKMLSISHLLDSPDGMAYQVTKKLTEGLAMAEVHRTKAELYGALNYLAGIVIFLEDREGEPQPAPSIPTSDYCTMTPNNTHTWDLIEATRPGLGSYCTACLYRPAAVKCQTCNGEMVVLDEGGKPPYKPCPDCLA